MFPWWWRSCGAWPPRGRAHEGADGRSAALDSLHFGLQRRFHLRRFALAAGNPAYVGAVYSQLARDSRVQPPIKAVSLQDRLFAMMFWHQW